MNQTVDLGGLRSILPAVQGEQRLVNNREKVRDLWFDLMRVAADAVSPFASSDPAALAATFAAGASGYDPGTLWTTNVHMMLEACLMASHAS